MGKFDFDNIDDLDLSNIDTSDAEYEDIDYLSVLDDNNTELSNYSESSSDSRALANTLLTILAPIILKKLINFLSKDHGSKVKTGAYAECKIAMFDNKACIIVKEQCGIILLTRDTISSCTFSHEKYRLKRAKKYYYYDIVFKNNEICQIRVSEKYRDALLRAMQ